MSRDIENIMKEISKQSKEMHNMDTHISKDITELKRSVKNLELKFKVIDEKLDYIIEMLNTFTIIMSDSDEDISEEYLEDNEEWNPYADENEFDSYESEDSEDE
jgi:hypothetical protein